MNTKLRQGELPLIEKLDGICKMREFEIEADI
jgi:hypothetical protein